MVVPNGGRALAAVILVSIAYFVLGRLGLYLADIHENATLIWPPTGLSIGALLLLGPRAGLGVVLGATALNLSLGTDPGPSALIGIGNTLEAIAGWAALRAFGFDEGLRRMRDVGALVLVAPFAAAVSASAGLGALWSHGLVESDALMTVWFRWWAGDIAGAIVFLPLVTVLMRGLPSWSWLFRRLESWLILLLIGGVSSLAFLFAIDELSARALSFALLVVLVWAGLRLGARGAVLAGGLSSMIAVIGTSKGLGPFSDGDLSTRMLELWAYVTTNGGMVLVLAAAVSERVAASEQLLSAERERRELEVQMLHMQRLESLGVLAGGVAHDFNNLLTVVTGNASLIERMKTREERSTCIKHINLAATRASELCKQLLSYAGRASPEIEAVDLAEMTSDIGSLLRTTMGSNVSLRLEFGRAVPPVSGDPAMLQQILLNLLMNASEAIGDACGTVSIRTELRTFDRAYLDEDHSASEIPAGSYVALIIEDDGPGMAPETLQRVFEPFFSTKFSGRGLGLAAVSGVVHSHKGAIKVTSTLGEGTRFVVLLPASEGGACEPAAKEAPVQCVRGRWLVAEDEGAIRVLVQSALEEQGAEAVLVEDGQRAIEALEGRLGEFDGLLVDLTMPNKGGREVIAWLQERDARLPVVLMSGYAFAEGDLPEVVLLSKPFTISALRQSLIRAQTPPAQPSS